MKAERGLMWMMTSSITQSLLQFFSLLVLSRLLLPEDFGIVALAMVFVRFLKLITESGLGPAIVQRENVDNMHISSSFIVSIIASICVASIFYALAAQIENYFDMNGLNKVLKITALLLPLSAVISVGKSFLQKLLLFQKLSLIEITGFLISNLFVAIPLAYFGFGVWALVYSYLIQYLIVSGGVLYYLKSVLEPKFSFNHLKQLMSFSVGFSLAAVVTFVAIESSNVIVGKYLGGHSLGLYSRSLQLISMPAIIFGGAMDKFFFPLIAKHQKETNYIKYLVKELNNALIVIFLPIGLMLCVVSEEVIQLLLGENWSDAASIFSILALSLVFRITYKVSDILVRATGKVYARLIRQIVNAIVVMAGAFLGKYYGAYGVAIAMSVSFLLNWILMGTLAMNILRDKTIMSIESFIKSGFVSILFLSVVYLAKVTPLLNAGYVFFMLSAIYVALIFRSGMFLFKREKVFIKQWFSLTK